MDREIKKWMFVSIALALVEIGRVVGAKWGWHVFEHSLDAVAGILIVVMIVFIIIRKMRR